MQPNIQQYYNQIKDIKTQSEFFQEIQQRKKNYENLLTEEVIALLIIDELGRNTKSTTPIKDIQAGTECTISGTITEIHEAKNFTRKNQSTGQLKTCIITDETGSIPVTFWNQDTKLLEPNHMQNGSKITIINGYTKKGYHGIEINIGRWTIVENSQPLETQKSTHTATKETTITGTIQSIQPTNIFFKEDGTEGFIATLTLKTTKDIHTIICWNEQVKHLQQYTKGDTIKITNISYRYTNGQREIHVNGKASITKQKT